MKAGFLRNGPAHLPARTPELVLTTARTLAVSGSHAFLYSLVLWRS